eukprot:TRINITY_DN18111_c0_g1_i3.p1 TRINITY_DN18111_c0_g1~~TRINITY_DN18111_c0_g1_i3.p1  ORF type:complete len:355 (+),score=59.32 TRINITY_DN18111_c0_g1_i3:89-1153(+)
MGKAKKTFDWATAKCSHFLLRLAYVGTRYHGVAWQQPEMANTVENELFNALIRTCLIESREKCNFSRCGRTDRGVHAFGNHIAITLREMPGGAIEYVRLLNRVLPTDIRILAACPVPSDFDARFGCKGRVYKYFFAKEDYDVDRMCRAAQAFLGEHDFRNFCKADVEATSTFVRTVHEVSFDVQGPCVAVTIAGNAFLWHQIRCMMAILFLVGAGLEEERIISELLDVEAVPAKPIYELASEDGLVLFSASYPDLDGHLHPDPKALSAFRAAHADAQRRTAVMGCLADLCSSTGAAEGSEGAGASAKVVRHKKLLTRPVEPSIEERLQKQARTGDGEGRSRKAAGEAKTDVGGD